MFRTVIDCQEGVFSVYKDAAAKEQENPINYEVILLPAQLKFKLHKKIMKLNFLLTLKSGFAG